MSDSQSNSANFFEDLAKLESSIQPLAKKVKRGKNQSESGDAK